MWHEQTNGLLFTILLMGMTIYKEFGTDPGLHNRTTVSLSGRVPENNCDARTIDQKLTRSKKSYVSIFSSTIRIDAKSRSQHITRLYAGGHQNTRNCVYNKNTYEQKLMHL